MVYLTSSTEEFNCFRAKRPCKSTQIWFTIFIMYSLVTLTNKLFSISCGQKISFCNHISDDGERNKNSLSSSFRCKTTLQIKSPVKTPYTSNKLRIKFSHWVEVVEPVTGQSNFTSEAEAESIYDADLESIGSETCACRN
jgi:hypothetical protein